MKAIVTIALLIFCCTLQFNSSAATVNTITFEGLTKTKKEFLLGVIQCEIGMEFDSAVFKKDEQIIKNLNLFFHVEANYSWNDTAEGWDLLFVIKEAKYFYPILSVSGFKTQFKLEAGFNQINFRGKGESMGLVYQFYDRHTISGFYNAPRHKNGKTGHDLALTKYSTIEPLYFQDTVSAFNFDNYNISVGGHYWLNQNLRLGLGGMYMYERYKQLDTADFDLGDSEFFFHKYQARAFLDYKDVDQDYELLDGIQITTFFEMIQTVGYPNNSFLKFTNDMFWYKTLGTRGTLAFHSRLGIATNNDSPFSPFVLDGFINLRGVGNRVARGTAETIVNTEYRHSVWRHKWFIVQLAVFTDFGALRQPGAKFTEMFSHKEMKLFLGGGLRLHSRVLYNTSFRIDYSFSPMHPDEHGVTFGFGQFF